MIKLFLCGDVMTGRGIDQVLQYRSDPGLRELYVRDAADYVALAEQAHGPIPRPVDFAYIWGDALGVLGDFEPNCKVINLETSVTTSDKFWPGKSIHYRMHPENVDCSSVAGIDCCVLANNHVLDFGYEGLLDTLATLKGSGLAVAGAGGNRREAAQPAIVHIDGNRRVLVFACGTETSGIPLDWRATDNRPGVNLLPEVSVTNASVLAGQIAEYREPHDIVLISIHWGGNWGYRIPRRDRELAHALIDSGLVDAVHGHSSHHAMGIEVYRGRPIIYGCGDLINDYEGISGHEYYRGDLSLMYFVMLSREGPRDTMAAIGCRLVTLAISAAAAPVLEPK